MSLNVAGQLMIVVNSTKIASDLLEKRSSIYCDRPIFWMGGELVGFRNLLVFLRYGERFRRSRKLFHNLVGTPNIVKQYQEPQELESRRLLKRLLDDPSMYLDHVRKCVVMLNT
jgi:hypothetical protein